MSAAEAAVSVGFNGVGTGTAASSASAFGFRQLCSVSHHCRLTAVINMSHMHCTRLTATHRGSLGPVSTVAGLHDRNSRRRT